MKFLSFLFRPTPNVTWTKAEASEHIVPEHPKDYDVMFAHNWDSEKSHSPNNTHHIHLTNVQTQHSGYYECLGQNTAGKSRITRIRLDVEGKIFASNSKDFCYFITLKATSANSLNEFGKCCVDFLSRIKLLNGEFMVKLQFLILTQFLKNSPCRAGSGDALHSFAPN